MGDGAIVISEAIELAPMSELTAAALICILGILIVELGLSPRPVPASRTDSGRH